MRAPTDQPGLGTGRRMMAALLMVLCLVAATACGDDAAPTPEVTSTEGGLGVPDLPVPTEPTGPTTGLEPDASEAPAVTSPMAQAGPTVLLHLEGPIANREATDVVIRNDEGEEVDRFRLPGAIGVAAAPGASHALIQTLPGGFARYDATTNTLALVGFPGAVPTGLPEPGAGLGRLAALWGAEDLTTLLRLDTGDVVDLSAGELGEGAAILQQSADGEHLLVTTGAGLAVFRPADGSVRALDGIGAALSSDGALLATVTAPDPDRVVTVGSPDGSDQRVVGTIDQAAVPYPLPDGRVLVAGQTPSLLGPDLPETPLEGAVPIGRPIRVSVDGRWALATAGESLALVDLTAGTVTPLPATEGFAPLTFGPAEVLWAVSTDPEAPGGLVVDPSSGAVVRFLDDTPVVGVESVSADGQRAAINVVGADDVTSVVVDVTGTVTPVLSSPDRTRSWVHPGGTVVASELAAGSDRTLVVGPLGGDVVEIETGRSPVWLSTGAIPAPPDRPSR